MRVSKKKITNQIFLNFSDVYKLWILGVVIEIIIMIFKKWFATQNPTK